MNLWSGPIGHNDPMPFRPFVGTLAYITKWDGTQFTEQENTLYDSIPLTTIHGHGDEVYAVGGFGNAG